MPERPTTRPTPVDLAAGLVAGTLPDDDPATAIPSADGTPGPAGHADDPLVALEAAVRPALLRPPCLVSFSGGMDSSLILAVAARVARRDGLPDPVPVTWRFVDAPAAKESDWQDLIIRELALAGSWQVLTARDELDLVGPVARRQLRRHGVLYPSNTYLHLPIVELAPGGSLITGVGGDQILTGFRRPRPATPRAWPWRLAATVVGCGPDAWATVAPERAARRMFPWLHAEVAHRVWRAHHAGPGEPRRLGPRITWHLRRRELAVGLASMACMAAGLGVAAHHPLLDPGFLAALTARFGHRWRPLRSDLIAAIGAGELPDVLAVRRRKATFLEAFLREGTRRFVSSWDGTGVDERLVDVAALRTAWSRWPIPPGTAPLVHQAWLAQDRAEVTT